MTLIYLMRPVKCVKKQYFDNHLVHSFQIQFVAVGVDYRKNLGELMHRCRDDLNGSLGTQLDTVHQQHPVCSYHILYSHLRY